MTSSVQIYGVIIARSHAPNKRVQGHSYGCAYVRDINEATANTSLACHTTQGTERNMKITYFHKASHCTTQTLPLVKLTLGINSL